MADPNKYKSVSVPIKTYEIYRLNLENFRAAKKHNRKYFLVYPMIYFKMIVAGINFSLVFWAFRHHKFRFVTLNKIWPFQLGFLVKLIIDLVLSFFNFFKLLPRTKLLLLSLNFRLLLKFDFLLLGIRSLPAQNWFRVFCL